MSGNRRAGLRLPVKLLIDSYAGDAHSLCVSADLSPDGVFIYQRPDLGCSEVNLEFGMPGYNDRVWAYGKVKFRSDVGPFGGAGIAFAGIANLHRDLINDWLVKRRLEEIRRTLGWRPRRERKQALRRLPGAEPIVIDALPPPQAGEPMSCY